jgi:hypothetical protein
MLFYLATIDALPNPALSCCSNFRKTAQAVAEQAAKMPCAGFRDEYYLLFAVLFLCDYFMSSRLRASGFKLQGLQHRFFSNLHGAYQSRKSGSSTKRVQFKYLTVLINISDNYFFN